MTQVLELNKTVTAQIAEMVAKARNRVIPWSVLQHGVKGDQTTPTLLLQDRPPGFERPASEHVLIPHGFRAAFSFEEQPAGLCRHLSISVDQPGKLPHPEAVKMIADAFGFSNFAADNGRVWLEEFDPGHEAVNIVEIVEPAP